MPDGGRPFTLLDCARVAEMTGYTTRWVQKKAAAGKIPGAMQLGKHWRFDAGKVRRWIAASETREEWQPSIKEEKSGGGGSSSGAKNTAARLKQRLGLAP